MAIVMAISDLHCGHRAGLTPPSWQYVEDQEDVERQRWARMQRETWADYLSMIEPYRGMVDYLIVNGDCVDGKGERSGGTELITTDRDEQAMMAARAIKEIGARVIVMTFGTPYHVGATEDFERVAARQVGAVKIENEAKYRIEGKLFHCKHFLSSSVVPYGRLTSINRDKLWGMIWSEMYGKEKADITIRSHVHYYGYSDDTPFGIGLITPALQGPGTKFGGRICSGWVDFGISVLEVNQGEKIKCTVDKRPLSAQSQEPLDLTALLGAQA